MLYVNIILCLSVGSNQNFRKILPRQGIFQSMHMFHGIEFLQEKLF